MGRFCFVRTERIDSSGREPFRIRMGPLIVGGEEYPRATYHLLAAFGKKPALPAGKRKWWASDWQVCGEDANASPSFSAKLAAAWEAAKESLVESGVPYWEIYPMGGPRVQLVQVPTTAIEAGDTLVGRHGLRRRKKPVRYV